MTHKLIFHPDIFYENLTFENTMLHSTYISFKVTGFDSSNRPSSYLIFPKNLHSNLLFYVRLGSHSLTEYVLNLPQNIKINKIYSMYKNWVLKQLLKLMKLAGSIYINLEMMCVLLRLCSRISYFLITTGISQIKIILKLYAVTSVEDLQNYAHVHMGIIYVSVYVFQIVKTTVHLVLLSLFVRIYHLTTSCNISRLPHNPRFDYPNTILYRATINLKVYRGVVLKCGAGERWSRSMDRSCEK